MTIAADAIGVSPVGGQSSTPQGEEIPFKSTSIGSFAIGSLSAGAVNSQSVEFVGTAQPSSLDVVGLTPRMAMAQSSYSIGSHVIGSLSSFTTGPSTVESGFEATAGQLEIEVVGLFPNLSTDESEGFTASPDQLLLDVVGLYPNLTAEKILGYQEDPLIRSVEIVGSKPSLAPSADFPPPEMTAYFDSAKFDIEQDDPAIRQTTDGGYVITRPRYLTKPKRTYSLQFTGISDSDKVLLEEFWNKVLGGTNTFTLKTPLGYIVECRFATSSPFKYVYKGQGHTRLWDVTGIKIIEV